MTTENQNEETVIIGLKKEPLKSEREEKKRKVKRVIFTIVFCVLFCILGFSLGVYYIYQVHPTNRADSTNTLGEIEALLERYWVYAPEHEDLQTELEDKAFYGMTAFDEDPYTTYMSAEELKDFANGINMDYVGIGVQYTTVSGKAVIERVFKNSPAEKAGIQEGDIIVAVDSRRIDDLSSDEIKDLVIGEPQTKVVITVFRNNEELDVACIRDSLDSSVYCYTENDCVVMELSSFGENTAKECMKYLNDLENYNKIIIDLRNNTGGYQTSVKEIAGLFIGDKKVYLRQKDSRGNETADLTSCKKTYTNFNKIVLLTNGNTASAAEVFTICLKEQLPNVTIVGETTYGKGVIQSTNYLLNGGVLKFTTFNWYSPNGVSIHKTGIKPDIEVKLDDIAYEYYAEMSENEKYEYDSVSEINRTCELSLKFLGYEVDRFDGYFDEEFENALNQYKVDNGLEDNAVLDQKTYDSIISNTILELSKTENDPQYLKAIELLGD